MSDSDCGDSGGTCRTKNKVWWEEDENFPKDPKFGPYATWSRLQFHKKLLVLLLKILHLQNDLESQVPINGQFLGQITWLKQFLASSSLELGDAAQGASDQGTAQVADVTIKLDTDTKKLASDMMGLDSELHGIDATQDQRLADMETDGPFRQKMEGMTGDAYQRSSKLVSDQSALDAFWKSPAGSPSSMRPELTGMVDRSITETRGNIADGISRYTGFATTRYQTGYRHLDQLYRNFKFLTESNLRGAQRHMGRINATIAEREESVGDALDRIEEDGHLETGTVANETATVEELVQDILSHAEDLVTNTSASLEEAKLWKEAREAAAAAKEAAAAAAAASGTEPCDGPTKCHPENNFVSDTKRIQDSFTATDWIVDASGMRMTAPQTQIAPSTLHQARSTLIAPRVLAAKAGGLQHAPVPQAPRRGRTGLMPPQSRSPTAKKLSIYATQLMKSRDSSRSFSQTANCLQLPRTAGVHLMSRVLTVVMVVAAQSAVQPSALGFPHRSPTRKSTRTQPTEALVLPTFWIVKMLTAAGRPCQDSTCGPLRRCQSSHTGSNVLQGLISTFMRRKTAQSRRMAMEISSFWTD
jgi:hypothetical protein